MSFELFYFDDEGHRRDDIFHEELLQSESGRLALETAAVRLAMRDGMTLSTALETYVSPELRSRVASNIAAGQSAIILVSRDLSEEGFAPKTCA